MAKIGLLFLGRKRPGFDPAWGEHMETLAKKVMDALEFESIIHGETIADEVSLIRALEALRAAKVDVPVILQPTMSDGRLAARLGQVWPGPVVLWATPENPDSPRVSSCSLVGTHVFAANLRQLHRPFELVYGMPGDAAALQALDAACRVTVAHKRLHASKIGLIGYQAPGFIDMHSDPFVLSAQLGPELFHTGVQELLDRFNAVDPEEAEYDVETVLAMGLPLEGLTKEELLPSSRFYLALKAFFHEEQLDALAVREWPEVPNLTGHWPYLAIARLLEEGFPIACEGDVDGAVLSLMGCLMGMGAGFLTDWLEHDKETITVWHGGCAPVSLCEPPGSPNGPRIGRHFNSGKPAVINAVLKSDMPVTLARLWRCDGQYTLMVEEAVTRSPSRVLEGTTGLIGMHARDPRSWFRELCFDGMPHHLTLFSESHGEMMRGLARILGIRVHG